MPPIFYVEETEWLNGFRRSKKKHQGADTAPYKIIENPGGLYAIAVSIDGESYNEVRICVTVFLHFRLVYVILIQISVEQDERLGDFFLECGLFSAQCLINMALPH